MKNFKITPKNTGKKGWMLGKMYLSNRDIAEFTIEAREMGLLLNK